jgi:hypothetical protein
VTAKLPPAVVVPLPKFTAPLPLTVRVEENVAAPFIVAACKFVAPATTFIAQGFVIVMFVPGAGAPFIVSVAAVAIVCDTAASASVGMPRYTAETVAGGEVWNVVVAAGTMIAVAPVTAGLVENVYAVPPNDEGPASTSRASGLDRIALEP